MRRVIIYSVAFSLFKIATIGGGTNNVINPGTGDNAILGGSFNNDAGLSSVMIAGNGIAAAIPNALHINGLWANMMCGPCSAGLPFGTVYFQTVSVLPSPYNACKFLMIV